MGGGSEFVVRMRGLPWSCTEDEILKFFDPVEVKGGCDGIHITRSRDGRPNGEAFVEFENADDLAEAEKKHHEHIGRRYIEIFRAKPNELEFVLKKDEPCEDAEDDCCVKLRGLPFNCSKEEIYQFFEGLEVIPNGIAMVSDFSGRSTGEAFVQFVSKNNAEKALERHKEKIGHRYIEIFPSTVEQMRMSMHLPRGGGGMRGGGPFIGPQGPGNFDDGPNFGNMNFNGGGPMGGGPMGGGPMGGGPMGGGGFNNRMTPYDARDRMGGPNRYNRGFNNDNFDNMRGGFGGRGGRGGMRGNKPRFTTHSVRMRGLPFKATDFDIMDFFKPLETMNITIVLDNNGRASGEADVEFASHEDAVKAMDKHKAHMKHRYIELFLNSSPKDDEDGFNDMMGPGNMCWGQGQGGNWGQGGGNMGGMGGNMGGMGGNMGGSMSSMGDGMGGSGGAMERYGGSSRGGVASKGDAYVGKIKSTGRGANAWSDGSSRTNYAARSYDTSTYDKEKPAKAANPDDRNGSYDSNSYGGAAAADYKQENYSNFNASGVQASAAAYANYRAGEEDYSASQQQTAAAAGGYDNSYAGTNERGAASYSGSWSNAAGDYAGNRTGMANYSYT